MTKKTIYFHIGTHKTGSTAIQVFLKENKNKLLDKKYVYDFISNGINHMELSHDIRLWDSLNLDSDYNYIFSSEDFYSSFFQSEKAPNILNLFTRYPEIKDQFYIKVIVYLRRQDHYIQSVYNELIKRHGYHKKISLDVVPLDYYKILSKISSEIGKENVIVRPYEKEQFVKGDILYDFCNAISIDKPEDFSRQNIVINPSLKNEKLEFIKYINMLNLPDELRFNLNKIIVKMAIDSKEVGLFRKQNLLSPEDSIEILSKYSSGNSKIANEYLGRPEGQLFYEKLPQKDEKWCPYPGLSKNIANEIISLLAKNNRIILDDLFNEINKEKELTPEFIEASDFIKPIIIEVLSKDGMPTIEQTNLKKTTPFSRLNIKIKSGNQSADILREVALAFELAGDILTASKIMEQAYLLRKDGPLINKKIEEYRDILNSGYEK